MARVPIYVLTHYENLVLVCEVTMSWLLTRGSHLELVRGSNGKSYLASRGQFDSKPNNFSHPEWNDQSICHAISTAS